ncbi:MAG: hypothetical protein AAFY20_10590 [Cyanobacteria bacterium J06639_14]
MENLKPDILESLTEYDLPDIIDALVELHGCIPVADILISHLRQDSRPGSQPPEQTQPPGQAQSPATLAAW